MNPRPRLLFASYSRLVPVAQIGVLKRCLRLMPFLPADIALHLLNFGPLPEFDPLVREVCPGISVHLNLHDADDKAILDFLRWLQPKALVLGEAPLAGSMAQLSRLAAQLGIPQVGIENFYGDFVLEHLRRTQPQVFGWLTLGLLPGGQLQRSTPRLEVVPPFVRPPSKSPCLTREGICLLGYDNQTLVSGIKLLGRLPDSLPLRLFTTPQEFERLSLRVAEKPRRGVSLHAMPGEAELNQAIASSKVVFCKNGYQQIVEALCLGARVVCRVAPGGVLPELIDRSIQPYVRPVDDRTDLEALALEVALWCCDHEPTPWVQHFTPELVPARLGAQRLLHLLGQAVLEREGG